MLLPSHLPPLERSPLPLLTRLQLIAIWPLMNEEPIVIYPSGHHIVQSPPHEIDVPLLIFLPPSFELPVLPLPLLPLQLLGGLVWVAAVKAGRK